MRCVKQIHRDDLTSSRLKDIEGVNTERVSNSDFVRVSRRLERRERNRLYMRQYRKRVAAAETASVAAKKKMLTPLKEEDRADALKRLQRALGPEGLDECVCVSCDRLVRREDSIRKEASDWRYMTKMRGSFGEPDARLSAALRQEYSAPACLTFLADTLVSPRSFRCYRDNRGYWTAWFNVCNDCNLSIEQGCLPKFAISNGFCIGSLPDKLAHGLTLPERFMTQLVSIAAMTRVMRGGRHRCIRSHSIVFDCTPGPPISLLPRSISDVSTFRVAMVGDFTEGQKSKVKKMHTIQGQRVQDVFTFYRINNPLYASVTPNDAVLNELMEAQRVEQLVIDEIEDARGSIQNKIGENQENIRGHDGNWQVPHEEDELTVVERRLGLSDAARVLLSENHRPANEGNGDDTTKREFLVKRSNKLSLDVSGDLLAKMFPHLFPHGRGHPGENRRVTVSLKECVKHYTMLSTRRFAEDELFTVVSFDRISMKNMYTQNGLRCQRFPKLYDRYESIDTSELKKALLENEQRQQGRRASSTPTSIAHKFLKTVEIASAAVWGSNAERSKCRQKAIAYQTRFGMPALFMTLTPNTDNSFAMAYRAGKTSVSSLFDIFDASTPNKSELREASLGNDSASARLFMYQVDTFIKHVLGLDPTTGKPTPFKGLLGDVEAYFGMVETQGRGTLHIHFLVWLSNSPSSTSELEEVLASSGATEFRESVVAYVDSIVRNKIPLPLERYSCRKCGAPYSELSDLKIPPRAKQNPRRGIFSAQAHRRVVEPALVYCKVCNTPFSSQHVLRSVLVQGRPLHWPPWERELNASEVDRVARSEAGCRDTMAQAVDIVNQREKIQMSLRSEAASFSSRNGLMVTPEVQLLKEANAFQMSYRSSEDDPFQNDELTRLLETIPPMIADSRMTRDWMDYMVSVLVVLLNQHWWCHTSSCFKASRVTVSDDFCRYNFPRSRKACTTFDLSGVDLERQTAHEYINGFNYELMASFKCNHDIQVLIGGKDTADRIHYCTKYVTKQQKRLDSVVVMALAAFRRRQEREASALSGGDTASHDFLSISRRRVASMVYTMTSRQEIAGPLAALYLYRGSCCYESSGCCFVPLRDIVDQLCSTDAYTCQLVDGTEGAGTSRFLAVSFLDDYVYRPDTLSSINVYEFAMRYYRKKSQAARLRFKPEHPLHRTHSLVKRYQEVVPVIQGFRLPFVDQHSPEGVRYKHAILSLVLFKPFRQLEDLIGPTDSSGEQWLHSFNDWEPCRSEFVKKIMNHISDYHCGVERASSQADAAAKNDTCGAAEHEVDGSCSDDDSLFSVVDFDDEADEDFDDSAAFCDPWVGQDSASNTVFDSQSLHPSTCPTAVAPDGRIVKILNEFTKHHMLGGSAQSTVAHQQHAAAPEIFPDVHIMQKWVKNAATDCNLCDTPSTDPVQPRGISVVEILAHALEEDTMMWNSPHSPAKPYHIEYATITDISREFTLNEKQHCAFQMIGRALLTRWQHVEDSSYLNCNLTEALERDQLKMFLGGEGGTGKSRVLDAVQALCTSWQHPECIVKTALTGKAATVIGGRTLASLLIQLRRRRNGASAACVDIVVVDEVSMMRKSQLAQLDSLLRTAKRVTDVPFGGVHIILVGDFLQLPPVGAEPLYKDPALARYQPTANDLAGYHLWLAFTDVIVLEESVRFRADPEWGRGCQFARRGVWLPEFVDIINTRVTGNAQTSFNEWHPGRTIPTFITPDNKTRLAINNLFISTAAGLLPDGEYPCRVVANFHGKLARLGSQEISMIMSLPDSSFGRMAPYLDLIVGMPVQLTQNVRAEKMAVNGTHGTLETIIFSPGTSFRVVHDSIANITVKIPNVPPPAVIVRIPRGRAAKAMKGCTDSDLFPLFSNAKPYKECDIRLPPSRLGNPRSLSVQIEQFPMVCAVASTVYKVQGETLADMVVTQWRSQNGLTNKRQQPYLLVSRVTSRNAFRALSPLTSDIISWAQPPKDALEEEARLQRLSETTIGGLNIASKR